jgi:hypothetical protein
MFDINNCSWVGLKDGMSQIVLMRLEAIMIIEEMGKCVHTTRSMSRKCDQYYRQFHRIRDFFCCSFF